MQNQMRERMVASQVRDENDHGDTDNEHSRWRGPGRCSSGWEASTSSLVQQCWRDLRGERALRDLRQT